MDARPYLNDQDQLYRTIQEAVIPTLGKSYWNTLRSYGIYRPLTPKMDKMKK